jgi:alkylation response protein AidB-like acyl-CoA dehydrogenase
MELRFSEAEQRFQREVQDFIAQNLPDDIRQKMARGALTSKEENLRWHRILYRKGWAAPTWPKEYGGTGWTVTERFIFEQESSAADAPWLMPFGLRMVGPVIYTFGSDDQKKRFLPRILAGEDYWCQGYSEPGAGSDLAALRTRAVLEGDHFVVNGQKTWTSLAHVADMMFCLVRTNTTGKRQEGISFLLIDMKTPGIIVRPIITIDNGHHVNDVFFDSVRVPRENLVGEIDKGWTYAKFLLTYERTDQAEVARNKRRLQRVKALAREVMSGGRPLIENDDFAGRLVDAEVELAALEITNLRVLASEAAGRSAGNEASLLKMKGTELHQTITELACEAAGYYALPFEALPGAGNEPLLGPPEADGLMEQLLYGRAKTIWGGSNEIQRNVIAKQVLGL